MWRGHGKIAGARLPHLARHCENTKTTPKARAQPAAAFHGGSCRSRETRSHQESQQGCTPGLAPGGHAPKPLRFGSHISALRRAFLPVHVPLQESDVTLRALRPDQHRKRSKERHGHQDRKQHYKHDEQTKQLEESEIARLQEGSGANGCDCPGGHRQPHLIQRVLHALLPVLVHSSVIVCMQQMHGIIHRQPDHSDQEDGLIRPDLPPNDRDQPQETQGDAGDIQQTKQGNPPIAGCQEQDNESDDQRPDDSSHGSGNELLLERQESVRERDLHRLRRSQVLSHALPIFIQCLTLLAG
mmetsp:Transcript_14031/g.35396  ORF Transcript_14031/g.35396 Transcript_14031/m.35396 type:complete len:299 (+) Transcript_14031:34-930(+)